MATEKVPENYECSLCEYTSSRLSLYTRHLSTQKHLKHSVKQILPNTACEISNKFVCDKCSKVYKDRSGLWRHSNKCNVKKDSVIIELLLKEMVEIKNNIIDVMKNNFDLQKQLEDIRRSIKTNSYISNKETSL